MVAGANYPEPSRVQQLVTSVRSQPQPGRHYGLSPHVLAVTCPPRILGEVAERARFVAANAPVFAEATRVIVEAHNGCAGLAHFYKDRLERVARDGSPAPYFELQRQLLERGVEQFARRVAMLSKRDLLVEANYVDFGSSGSVADVTIICTFRINSTGNRGEPALLQQADFQETSGYDPYKWV